MKEERSTILLRASPLTLEQEREKTQEIYDLHIDILTELLRSKAFTEQARPLIFRAFNTSKKKNTAGLLLNLSDIHVKGPKLRRQWAMKIQEVDQDLQILRLGETDPELQPKFQRLFRLRDSFLKHYHGIARYWAHRGKRYWGLTLEDRIQVCLLGLVYALDKFNPNRGYRFSTYAGHWLRDRMIKAHEEAGPLICLPLHMRSDIPRIQRMLEECDRDGLMVDPQTIAQELGTRVSTIRAAMLSSIPLSLEAENEDWMSLLDCLPSDQSTPEDQVVQRAASEAMEKALQKLSPRERQVIQRRYWEDLSLEEIAPEFQITRQGVSLIEQKALQKLKRYLKREICK